MRFAAALRRLAACLRDFRARAPAALAPDRAALAAASEADLSEAGLSARREALVAQHEHARRLRLRARSGAHGGP
ncbi:MAG: hypothetical protein JNL66_09075 [Alphaproteobacteria bacterium]|nr:hypothetical protein [Alphaproteobacteria bacterium]